MPDDDDTLTGHPAADDARWSDLPVDPDVTPSDLDVESETREGRAAATGGAGGVSVVSAEGPGPFRPRGRARVEFVSHRVRGVLRSRWDVLGVIAAGGAIGSLARWGLTVLLPHPTGTFPWATFVANVTGCGLIGVLMVFVIELWPPSRYVRPFLGVGVLGGFTTFSTYMLDARALVVAGQTALAGQYVFGSLAAGLTAVWIGITAARLVVRLVVRTVERRRADRREGALEPSNAYDQRQAQRRVPSAGPAPAPPSQPSTSTTRSTR